MAWGNVALTVIPNVVNVGESISVIVSSHCSKDSEQVHYDHIAKLKLAIDDNCLEYTEIERTRGGSYNPDTKEIVLESASGMPEHTPEISIRFVAKKAMATNISIDVLEVVLIDGEVVVPQVSKPVVIIIAGDPEPEPEPEPTDSEDVPITVISPIFKEQEEVLVKTYRKETDGYGQQHTVYSSRNSSMFIRKHIQSPQSDIRYNDIVLIGLTHDNDISDRDNIIYKGQEYKVRYTIESRRWRQVFMALYEH